MMRTGVASVDERDGARLAVVRGDLATDEVEDARLRVEREHVVRVESEMRDQRLRDVALGDLARQREHQRQIAALARNTQRCLRREVGAGVMRAVLGLVNLPDLPESMYSARQDERVVIFFQSFDVQKCASARLRPFLQFWLPDGGTLIDRQSSARLRACISFFVDASECVIG